MRKRGLKVSDWREEGDYREAWDQPPTKPGKALREEFCFREAGVARFNDVVDDGYEDPGHEA